jgi:hypothetical protein
MRQHFKFLSDIQQSAWPGDQGSLMLKCEPAGDGLLRLWLERPSLRGEARSACCRCGAF